MNSGELKEFLDYMQKNHSWEHMHELLSNKPTPIFKYIDICYDTRDLDRVTPFHVWSISLRESSKERITFQEEACNLEFIKKVLSLPYSRVKNYIKEDKVFFTATIKED